jgi:hypothetical protein
MWELLSKIYTLKPIIGYNIPSRPSCKSRTDLGLKVKYKSSNEYSVCRIIGKKLQSSNQFLRDIEAVVEFARHSKLKIDAH